MNTGKLIFPIELHGGATLSAAGVLIAIPAQNGTPGDETTLTLKLCKRSGNRGTGKVELRQRSIKAIDLGKTRMFVAVAQAVAGRLEAWTFIPTSKPAYVEAQRAGQLVFARVQ